jgi:hypothetical protein
MKKFDLGKIEKVDIRNIWEHEGTDFTPWLAKEENIELLGSAIGIDLIVEAEEKDVGPFRADILCKDEANGNWVLIENQLEKTDHRHLGQLLTYATGLNAVTIIWVASKFNEEHRAALDWLNNITSEEYNFFGIQIEVLKIGNNMAPNFEIVSKPNNWSKSVSTAASKIQSENIGETKLQQLAFWEKLVSRIKEKDDSPLSLRKPRPQHWHTFASGTSGVGINAVFNSQEDRVLAELYIVNDKSIFENLEKDKNNIENELGEKLDWQLLPHRAASRIKLARKNSVLDNQKDWDDYIVWLIEKLEKFYQVFSKRLNNIN